MRHSSQHSRRSAPHHRSSAPVLGIVKRHPDGFGFFVPDNSEIPDVYIPRHEMDGLMTHDRVKVRISREHGGDRFRGEVVEVVSRGLRVLMGAFHVRMNGGGFLKDESHAWGSDIEVDPRDTMGAEAGEMVSVEITKYPNEGGLKGKIIKRLGDLTDPLNDVHRVMSTQGIPHLWPASVDREEKGFSEEVHPRETKGRKDLRKKKFITIDGATARDFDDAIYVESGRSGWTLWVGIADVSHYVKPGTAIDKEAYLRGNSVYFPNFVVPMLPEKLSNGLCSLNPHVDRLVLVAEIHFDFQGEVLKSDFYEAVIHSVARVTYGEAQEVIDGESVEKLKHVSQEISRAADLAKLLMAKRFRDGSLELEIPEIQLLLDDTGRPIDIVKSERLFSHRLIEEMMLAANVAVAKKLSENEGHGLYRIHDQPNAEALGMLTRYLETFGSKADMKAGLLQKRLTKALQQFEGKPEAQVLNILTLRSMAQAKYSPRNIGHFGLGFSHYSHFTSPIRRYPDLIVHRLLKARLGIPGYQEISEDDLMTSSVMLSATEQRAVKCERQHLSIKKARYMEQFIGQEFEGLISSVTKFGFFVLLRPLEVDGLVPIESLGKTEKDRVDFDEDNLRLVHRRSGFSYEIGQRVKVKVLEADSVRGQVDFGLVEAQPAMTLMTTAASRVDRQRKDQDSRRSSNRGGRHRDQDHRSAAKESRGGKKKSGKRSGLPLRPEKKGSSTQGKQAKNSHGGRDDNRRGPDSGPSKRSSDRPTFSRSADRPTFSRSADKPTLSRSADRPTPNRSGDLPSPRKTEGGFDIEAKMAEIRAKHGGGVANVKGKVSSRPLIRASSSSRGSSGGKKGRR